MNRTSLLTILAIASTLNATIPTNENVTKLYVATFNRAPDTNGLSYWVNDSNLDLEGISSSFFNQQETQDLYPKTTSNKDFISSVYQNLFNRVPDNDGWNYWENELNTGVIQRSQFIQAVVDGAKDTDNSNDKTILSNKTTVGLLFSNSNLNDKNQARDILIGVNQDTASVDYAQSSISDMQSSNISTNINLGSQNLPTLHILPRIFDEDGDDTNMKETYTLTANKDVNVTIQTPQGSWITPMWRYNNNPLPILIKTTRGNEMTLNFNNKLDSDSTIHWHGFKIPAEMDGGPDTPILPLQSKKYSFTMNQPAASMWFHPHPDMQTGKQVYMGLAGVYLLEDDISKSLEENNQLPSGDKDTVLLVQDRRFQGESTDTVRNLVYMNQRMDSIGMYGDTVLVNGSVLPKHEVSNTKFRYRLYNVSNARNYNFALSDGENFTIVGTDGGLLKNPVEVNHILLGPAERVDIIIDFSKYNVGNNIMLIDKSNGTSDKLNIMRFDITKYDTETITIYSELPNTAEISTRLNEADADNINNERKFIMSTSMGMGSRNMSFVINGKVFKADRVDEFIKNGATEIWNISNISSMAHPFHAHAIQYQILTRNGIPASGTDLGLKDTFLVQPGENVRIIGRFDPIINQGDYMYHCHILEHEDAGMMGYFRVGDTGVLGPQ